MHTNKVTLAFCIHEYSKVDYEDWFLYFKAVLTDTFPE